MRDDHIINILDNSSLRNLPERDLQMIRAHVETCLPCQRAHEAAQISDVLIETRAQEAAEKALEINPFFHTRVLAALREQQALTKISAFRRLWNVTGALVASMAATTAAFAVLSLVAPATETTSPQTAALVPYSAEAVLLDQDQDDNQMTNDQVFSAIYVDDEGK
jgi:hypothetical protein